MITRIVVALALAPVLLAVLLVFSPVYTVIFVAGVSAVGALELLRAAGAAGNRVLCTATAAAAALIPVCYWQGIQFWGVRAVLLVFMFVLFLTAILAYGKEKPVRAEEILFSLFGGVLIPVCLSALIQLKMMEKGSFLVLLPIIVAWLTDIGAYFVGMFLGKHRGITKVSPNKSAEGFVGGLLSGAVFMVGYAFVLQSLFSVQVDLLRMFVYGVVGSFATELGDLSFSLIKRQFGVKDYGKLLPGHGGMLDRFDSMVFAAPTMWLLVTVFPAL